MQEDIYAAMGEYEMNTGHNPKFLNMHPIDLRHLEESFPFPIGGLTKFAGLEIKSDSQVEPGKLFVSR